MERDKSGSLMVRLSQLLSMLTCLGVAWVFFRYAFRAIPTEELVIGHRLMPPATGIELLLLSFTLLKFRDRPLSRPGRAARLVAAVAACIVSGAVLLSNALLHDDFISPRLTALLFNLPPSVGGQAGAAIAIAMFFLGAAQLARLLGDRKLCNLLTTVPLFFSGVALLGYAYGVRELYAFKMLNTMALHSSASVAGLAVATLLVQRKRSWLAPLFSATPGGTLSRQLFAVTCALPAAGWLLVKATSQGALNVGMALASLIIVAVIPLLALAVHAGARQDELHAEHDARARAQDAFAETLEQRLAQQANALHQESEERAKAELAMFRTQRLEAIGQLTGGIAHDFNNLLMAITGSHYLLDQMFDASSAAGLHARKHLKNAMDATRRGEKLTNQLLAFSRKQKLDIKPTELRLVFETAIAMIGSALGPDIRLNCRVHRENLFVLSDAMQLELAIINLAMNARDAMPDGGELSVSTAPMDLLDASHPNEFIVIRVVDTGVGMSDEVAAHAVEPFFTTKPQGTGTGLGLAQVYGFVRQCGGEFRLTSALGEGTTVEMTFPVAVPPVAVAPEVLPCADGMPTAEANKLLLLIDDDENVRTALSAIFSIAGYGVIESANGENGIDLLKTHKPAAAIIDFLMPGMNGAQVARIARTYMPDLPIIFVSGYYDTLSLEGISNAVVMRKPVEIDALLHRVAAVTSPL